MNNQKLKNEIDSLTVFGSLKDDPAIRALREFLEAPSVDLYSRFASAFYPAGADFASYVSSLVMLDDNFYILKVASGETVDREIVDSVRMELTFLEDISRVSPADLAAMIDGFSDASMLPAWRSSRVSLLKDFTTGLADISRTGYGMFAEYLFFRLGENSLIPVAHPDFRSLDSFFGYERERNLIIRNTEALVRGTVSNNLLLYGDMGTGKSSTIKAVAAAFADQGLRLVEIRKDQLVRIPDLLDMLAANPLKFIVFIDDLSFTCNDDNFSALKAVLEGSVCGCGDNTVIYATSNRRHLVRESAADRRGFTADDDLHVNDTLQETMSLSARFGLTITFGKPDRDEYLAIVESLAENAGMNIADSGDSRDENSITREELFSRAEAFAIRKNGRSPRTARQFIELLEIM